MPYLNNKTSAFGIDIGSVRAAHPNVSIPEGLNYGNFEWYTPSAPPVGHLLQLAVEIFPEGNIQRWTLTPLSAVNLFKFLHDRLTDEYNSRTKMISDSYPRSERESWPIQIEEARAYLKDSGTFTPWLSAAATSRGIPILELATKIVAKDNFYREIHGALTGTRQFIEDKINSFENDLTKLLTIDVSAGWPS